MLAFRKAIICLKKSFEAIVRAVQRPRAEKSEAKAWELHQILCEFGENWLELLMLLEKRLLLGFHSFCAGTFPLWTLLPEVSGVVLFCVCE